MATAQLKRQKLAKGQRVQAAPRLLFVLALAASLVLGLAPSAWADEDSRTLLQLGAVGQDAERGQDGQEATQAEAASAQARQATETFSLRYTLMDLSVFSVPEPDYSWYSADEDTFVFTNEGDGKNIANKMVALANIVNGNLGDSPDAPEVRDSFLGKTILLDASVDFLGAQWRPIGSTSRPFLGTFDGQGNEVRGFTITTTYQQAGLFGFVGWAGTLRNVTLTNSVQGGIALGTQASPYTGGKIQCVGTLVGENEGTIEHCSSSMTLSIYNDSAVSDELLTIGDAIGGLVGRSNATMVDCSFAGAIGIHSATDATTVRDQGYIIMTCIGGVVGFFGDLDSPGTTTATLQSCYNTGTLRVDTAGYSADDRFGVDTVSQAGYVGGVVGYTTGSVYDCYNTGAVDTSYRMSNYIPTNGGVGETNLGAAGSYIGGVIGAMRSDIFPGMTGTIPGAFDAGTGCQDNPIEAARCYNTGMVFGHHAVGGVVGVTGWYSTVTNCYCDIPVGTATPPSRSAYSTDAAYVDAYCNYMVAAGGVKGVRWNKPMIGGIVGKSYGNISYCYNRSRTWSTTDAGYYVAGIAGVMFRGTSIEGYRSPEPHTWACYNTGYAQSSLRAANIAGQNEGLINDCYSLPETAYRTSSGEEMLVHSQYATVMRIDYLSEAVLKSSEGVSKLNYLCDQEGWTSSYVIPSDGETNNGFPILAWQAQGADKADLADPSARLAISLVQDADYTGGPALPQLSVTYNGKRLYQNADFAVVVADNAVDSTLDTDRTTTLRAGEEPRPYTATITGIGGYSGTPDNLYVNYGIVIGNIADCTVSITEHTYDGKAVDITAEDVTLYTKAGTVVPKNQYTFELNKGSEMVRRGSYEVAVQATDGSDANFVGSLLDRAGFTIAPANLDSDATVESISSGAEVYTGAYDNMHFTYTGDVINPTVDAITYEGMTLVQGTSTTDTNGDYAVRYDLSDGDYTSVREEPYQFAVESCWPDTIGNFHNYIIYSFAIVPANIEDVDILVPDQAYTGQERGLVLLEFNGAELVEGVDYTVAYANNVGVGTATATIEGLGNFTGTAVREYQITNEQPVALAANAIQPIPSQSWTGSAVEPELVVKSGDTVLTPKVDYIARYSNNTDAGTATVVVEGCGAYSGTVQATFQIVAHTLSMGQYAEKLPDNRDSTVLVDGERFRTTQQGAAIVEASAQKGPGATVEVVVYRSTAYNRTCNFTGIMVQTASGVEVPVTVEELVAQTEASGVSYLKASFTMPDENAKITKLNYTQATLQLADCSAEVPDAIYTGEQVKPAVKVTAPNGTQLAEGTDFIVVQYRNNIDIGTDSATVVLAGAGSYTGKLEATFSILPAVESRVWADDVTFTYDGMGHTIGTPETDQPNPTIRYYNEEAGDYSLATPPTFTEAGTYEVKFVSRDTGMMAYGQAKVTINRRPATVTARDANKGIGQADPVLRADVENVLPRDEGSIAYTISRSEGEELGTYAIFVSGDAVQGNYTVTYGAGTFTIKLQADLVVDAQDVVAVYDGAPHTVTPQATVASATITYAADAAAAAAGNYDLSEAPAFTNVVMQGIAPAAQTVYFKAEADGQEPACGSATVTITPRAITVVADDASKTYLAKNPTNEQLVGHVENLAEGDAMDVTASLLGVSETSPVGVYEDTLNPSETIPSGSATSRANYTISYQQGTFTIEAAPLSQATATAPQQTYDGTEKKPTARVTYTDGNGSQVSLAQGKDYAIAGYKNNVNAGTGTVVLEGMGNFTGQLEVPFGIEGASIANATVSGIANKAYTGSAIAQSPTVALNGKTLKAGTDYTLSYSNNVNVGTATVTITGAGNYRGSLARSFSITSPAKQRWIRLKGTTAYDTMQSIVKEGWSGTGGTVIVATGEGFADALAAAGIAGLENAPILTTAKKSLSTQTRTELNRLEPKNVIIVGGRGAVSTDVENAIAKLSFKPTVTRHKGAQAFNTANAMNLAYKGNWSTTAILATSKGYADALSAAPIAYSQHMPIFLVKDKNSIDAETISTMKTLGIKKVMVVGGRGAVSDTVRSKLKSSGFTVDTRKGASQYDTSIEVAKWGLSLGMSADKMGVATGRGYADALAGAALCGQNNAVLVLADKDNHKTCLPIASDNKKQISYGYVYGGRGAVPADVQNAYEKASGCPVSAASQMSVLDADSGQTEQQGSVQTLSL